MHQTRISLIFFVFWFLGVIFWPSDSNRPSSGLEKGDVREGLYQSPLTQAGFGLLGVNFFETENGKKHWNIRSAFAELHRKDNYAFMKQVDADFFAERTGNVIRTVSDYCRSRLDQRFVHLEGAVRVQSKLGYVFTMDQLDYTGADRQFLSPDPVVMVGPDPEEPEMILTGIGLTADIDRERFRLRRKVSARKRLSSSNWLLVHAGSGEFNTHDQVAVFAGKVESALPEIEIRADKLRLESGGKEESILAQGNVVVRNKDRVGFAEKAFLKTHGDEVTLSGSARVETGEDKILGQTILLHTGADERIEVLEAKGKVNQ